MSISLTLAAAAGISPPSRAYTETSQAVYREIGVKEKNVITGTILTGEVMPGGEKQVVAMTTYFTGNRKDKARAVNVELHVFRREDGKLVVLYSRDFGEELGGYVGRGEIQLIDLDRDGVNEIIATYDDYRDPLITKRSGEVIVLGQNGFRAAWTGVMEYDATREARQIPPERRDRYVREIDIRETLRTRGVTLFMNKKVIAVAGERLPEPKIVQETFPLKPSANRW
jgi:hypothetical protein